MRNKSRVISMVLVIFMIIGVLPVDLTEADKNNSDYIKDIIDYVNFSGSFEDTYKTPSKKKINNQENIIINPIIQIKLKNKLGKDKLNSSKIKLKSNDGNYFVLDERDIWINHDDQRDESERKEFGGKILNIDLNSTSRNGKYSLRKDTLYKLVLEKGAIGENENIEINFITGHIEVNASGGLDIKGHSSDSKNIDDITQLKPIYDSSNVRTQLGKTQLDIGRDGKSIYIHFEKDIRWNTDKLKNTDNISKLLGEEDLKHFKFYKVPKAYEKDETNNYDKEFRYNKSGKVHFKNVNEKMDELDIDSIEVLSGSGLGNVIKVTPKDELLLYNMYYLKLDDSEIITDIYGRELKKSIDKYVWTANENEDQDFENRDRPKWTMDRDSNDPYDEYENQITAEEIIDNENSPSNESVSYKLYGVPKYNEFIDKDKGRPIILNVDDEVIPNPRFENNKMKPNNYGSDNYYEKAFNNVELFDSHLGFNDGEVAIKWYQFKYFIGEDGKKKTKIYLYPEGELDSGKSYQLFIGSDAFVNKSGQYFDRHLRLNFTVEGQKAVKRGIYSINVLDYPEPLYVRDDITSIESLAFKINGFNFTEDIKGIRLENILGGKEIVINDSYDSKFTFINVDELELKLKGDKLKEFLKEGRGGEYKVYIDFRSGSPAIPVGQGSNSILIYEKPHVIETLPVKDDWSFDKRNLYKDFPNGDSGNYLKVIFDNIGGLLKYNPNMKASDFDFYSKDKADGNFIDTEREVLYEGFCDSNELMKYNIEVSGEKREAVTTPYETAKLYIDDDKYAVGDEIEITLFDHDLKLNEAMISVSIGNGEARNVTLIETKKNSGEFKGKIKVWSSYDTKEGSDVIEVKYVKRQSGDGMINKEITQKAKVVNKVGYRRKAQVYIEKDIFKKNEDVKITVVDKFTSKKRVEVKVTYPDDSDKKAKTLSLPEKGVNTGIFEIEDPLDNIEGKFNITYTYTEEEKTTDCKSGKAIIYIPIKNDIDDDTIYIAKLPEGIVYYDLGDSEETNKWKNNRYEWSFKTSDGPTDSKVDINFKGSAPEDYDKDYKIILKGENFDESVEVYFRDISDKKYKGRAVVSKGKDELNVYLPTGSDRLKVGLYDILVGSIGSELQEIKYGVLSVVPRGSYVPNEEHRIKDTEINGDLVKGDLKEIIKTSKNEVELSSKYTSQTLNLDEILGEQVLVREIKYDGSSISTLDTKSKWADIKLKGLKRDSSSQPMTIRLGRAEPTVSDSIKKKFTGDSIKSDFIQVSGTNYKVDSAELSIPYRESNGDSLKVLRYDEDTRRIDTNISFRVDKANKKVDITNAKKGIYVIVE